MCKCVFRYALEDIARRCQSRWRARILAALGAIDAVAPLAIGGRAEKSDHTGREAMRALLNLSAEPRNQVAVAHSYRDSLIAQAKDSKKEDLRW